MFKIDFQHGSYGDHLGFLIRMMLAIFDLQVTPILNLSSFKSFRLSVHEKKFKTDFRDGDCGGHLRFLIRTILAIFDLQI